MLKFNQSLNPVQAGERVLQFADYFSLWGSLGVGLLVMMAGASLLPALSLPQAFAAIAIGSVLGAALLGYIGHIGARTGLSSAGLIRPSLGRGLSWLPVALNIAQLIGWGWCWGLSGPMCRWRCSLFWLALCWRVCWRWP